MKRRFAVTLALLLSASSLLCGSRSLAQEATSTVEPLPVNRTDRDQYYNSSEIKTLGQLKSELRGRQRLARMEARRWTGYSPSRPAVTLLPFTATYTLQSERPARLVIPRYLSSSRQRPVVFISPSSSY